MTKKPLILALFALLVPVLAFADVFTTDTASTDSASTNYTIPFVRRGERGWDDRLNDGLYRIDQVLKIISDDSGSTVGAFTDLTDVPNSYVGEGGKYVKVKAGADGLEFSAAGAGGDMETATWDSDTNSAIDVDNGGTNAIDGWTIISGDVNVISQETAVISGDIASLKAPTFITQTASAILANEQALSGLTTGVMKVTNGTGVISTAADGTDYLAPTRIDDTKGNGDTGYVYSADKVFDELALKQAADADLTTYAGITPSANIQTLLGSADFAAARTNLGLAIGTNVQAFDADLTTYAGITPSANAQTLLGETFAQMQASLSIDDLITLSGMAEGSVNLSTFTGSTINDNVTVKAALQALETAVETKQGTLTNSAGLYGALNDETGSASGSPLAVFNQNPTIAGATLTGAIDAGGASSFEIPNGTSGTTDADGETYLDTDGDGGTNFSGPVIQIDSGASTAYLFPVALPLAATQDNYILKYDATGKTVQWEADTGAAASASLWLLPESAVLDDTSPPAITVVESSGTGTPRRRVADFDASTDEIVYWSFIWKGYTTATVYWYTNDTGADEDAIWSCIISATTEGDADSMAEDAGDTYNSAAENCNATEANRLIKTTISLSNVDSAATGDFVTMRFYRDADDSDGNADNDGLTSDARLLGVLLE